MNDASYWRLADIEGLISAMSALPPKANIDRRSWNVRFTPESGHSGPAGNAPLARTSEKHTGARQNNPDFGELARLSIDFD